MNRVRIPPWLRRAVEAALVAGLVATANLVGARMTAGADIWALPAGVTGALILSPSVFALAVVPTTYTVAMAATRTDAILGAIVAFLLAADVTAILAAGPLEVGTSGVTMAAGLLALLLALPAAIVGTVAGQVVVPIGFGRRAGGWAAVTAAVAAGAVLTILAAIA
ncbi:MAG: hypothetical protein AABZ33_11465 [Chloroflexota bacterium]